MHIQLRQSGFLLIKILRFKRSVQLFVVGRGGEARKPKQVAPTVHRIQLSNGRRRIHLSLCEYQKYLQKFVAIYRNKLILQSANLRIIRKFTGFPHLIFDAMN